MTEQEYENLYVSLSVMETDELIHIDTGLFTTEELQCWGDVLIERQQEIEDMLQYFYGQLEENTKKNTRIVSVPTDIISRVQVYLTDQKSVLN
jgi:hypothetical protein